MKPYSSEKIQSPKVRLSLYKALFVTKMLMKGAFSSAEVIDASKNDEFIQGALNIDTFRLIINALKNVGCEITKNSDAKFVMTKHPFGFSPSEKRVKILNEIKKFLLDKNDWKAVCATDDLFEHFTAEIEKNGQISHFRSIKPPFIKIKKNVLNVLRNEKIVGREILFFYTSSRTEAGLRRLFVSDLYCDRGRIYLKGRDFEKERFSVFNAEKIERIDEIKDRNFDIKDTGYIAEYKLKGQARRTFVPEENEEIISETDEEIIVRANINNEFKFFQKLIMFGTEFVLLSPENARMRFIDKLNGIIKRYE